MSFNKLTVKDISVENQTVLVRVDYNVPIKDGEIKDDYRIRKSLKTIEYLLDHKARVVLISHLGRPGGKPSEEFSLAPVAARLMELLHQPVGFVDDCIGEKVSRYIKNLPEESVVLLENLRFHPGEEANDYDFARQIADSTGARYFVQDGFGVVHRAHASTDAITYYIPAVAGFLVESEVKQLTDCVLDPKRPMVAIVGGAKISDKIGVISRFVDKADKILIGGAMANTFLAHRGLAVGKSKIEDGQGEVIDNIYRLAAEKVGQDQVNDFILLPADVAVGDNPDSTERRTLAVDQVGADDMILDIGPDTIERFTKEIELAKTVVWNGTLGFAENKTFAHGSARVALAIASNQGVTSVVGGGDTADFVLHWDGHDGKSFTHVSTGGGASIELMSGLELPGIKALLNKF